MNQHQEKNEPFKELGGYQQIVDGIVEEDDKVTITDANGKRICLPADIEIGLSVKFAMEMFDCFVYRKIPVARQGDIDHGQEVPIDTLQAYGRPAYKVWIPASATQPAVRHYIPQDSDERKKAPMFRGLLGYFPAALFEVARHSLTSDQKHNPGNKNGPHWARTKSSDHADCIVRHLIDAGAPGDLDRLEHLRSLAWRSLALLQEECEKQGARPGVSSR